MGSDAKEAIEYDDENDILYVQLSDGEVSWTKALDDLRLIDYSDDGAVVGIEFMAVSEGIDLTDTPFRHRIEELIGDSGLSFKILAG